MKISIQNSYNSFLNIYLTKKTFYFENVYVTNLEIFIGGNYFFNLILNVIFFRILNYLFLTFFLFITYF